MIIVRILGGLGNQLFQYAYAKSLADKGYHVKIDISAFKNVAIIQIRSLGFKMVELNFTELKAANFIVLMIPSNLNLNEVVVSASRWKQSSSNVPQKITSISPREVALQNPQTAADLLTVSGKVFMQKSQQGGGSPMIRGFATNR